MIVSKEEFFYFINFLYFCKCNFCFFERMYLSFTGYLSLGCYWGSGEVSSVSSGDEQGLSFIVAMVISSVPSISYSSSITSCLKCGMVCQIFFLNSFAPHSALRLPCVSVPLRISTFSHPAASVFLVLNDLSPSPSGKRLLMVCAQDDYD